MQKQAYDQLYQAENEHWYHQCRRSLVEDYLRYIKAELGDKLNILDAGCGTGSMFGLLEKHGQVTGLDKSDYALSLCQKKYPQATLKVGSVNNLREIFPQASFDLVTFFNVLYHKWVDDDAAVLKQAYQILKPGGYVVLVEPAFNCLFRNNDRFCYGIRRYSHKKISILLSQAGFCLKKSTYFNSISFIPLLISARLERWGFVKPAEISNELAMPSGYINNSFKFAMLLERFWINIFGKMPIGVSVLAAGRKIS